MAVSLFCCNIITPFSDNFAFYFGKLVDNLLITESFDNPTSNTAYTFKDLLDVCFFFINRQYEHFDLFDDYERH
jgi:hypothetical protein